MTCRPGKENGERRRIFWEKPPSLGFYTSECTGSIVPKFWEWFHITVPVLFTKFHRNTLIRVGDMSSAIPVIIRTVNIVSTVVASLLFFNLAT